MEKIDSNSKRARETDSTSAGDSKRTTVQKVVPAIYGPLPLELEIDYKMIEYAKNVLEITD